MRKDKRGKISVLSLLLAAALAALPLAACRAVPPAPELPESLISSEFLSSEETASPSMELSSEEPSSSEELPSQESREVSKIQEAVSKANTASKAPPPAKASSQTPAPSKAPPSSKAPEPQAPPPPPSEVVVNPGENGGGNGGGASSAGDMRAVWISFLEFQSFAGSSESGFRGKVAQMFDTCVGKGLNTVIVQVRPHGDAIYSSAYYPWSKTVSGKMGQSLSYDPLAILVAEAHSRGLIIEAWINPYRTMTDGEMADVGGGFPVADWYYGGNRDGYMVYSGQDKRWWLRPGSTEVQELIVNGVKELVQNYAVDGIHFDDYFYTESLSLYGDSAAQAKANTTALVRACYQAVKGINSAVQFGISPSGAFRENSSLPASDQGYLSTDLALWCTASGYIDYVMPQVYWDHSHATQPFSMTIQKWKSFVTEPNVKLYFGLAPYKNFAAGEIENQIQEIQADADMDGYCLFRYDFIHKLNL